MKMCLVAGWIAVGIASCLGSRDMRKILSLLVSTGVSVGCGASAWAQVTSNPDALAAPETKPVHRAAPERPVRHGGRAVTSSAASPAAAKGGSTPKQGQGQNTGLRNPPPVPDHPPPPVVIPPPGVSVPLHPPPPPPKVDVVPGAQGAVSALGGSDGGMRMVFGAGGVDLNAAMMEGVRALEGRLRANPMQRVTLVAYCGGTKDDLSTPRRISLARALNVRSVLINDGIAPTRIYARPVGLPEGAAAEGGADRIDFLVAGEAGPVPEPKPAPHGSDVKEGNP